MQNPDHTFEQTSSPKTIVITGASSGIGAACALRLAKDGHRLCLGARRIERLKEISTQCLHAGSEWVQTLPLDVTDNESVLKFCDEAHKAFGGEIDVLINNSGLALGVDHVSAGNIDDWQTMFDTNVMGSLRLARQLLPAMLKNKNGHVVFIGSIAGHQVYAGGAVYCATKHSIRAIAQALKYEVNGLNIRISSIDPGMVETEFSQVRFRGEQDKAKAVYSGLSPLTPADIADCVAFSINAPPHVNVDEMLVTPTAQASVQKVFRTI